MRKRKKITKTRRDRNAYMWLRKKNKAKEEKRKRREGNRKKDIVCEDEKEDNKKKMKREKDLIKTKGDKRSWVYVG